MACIRQLESGSWQAQVRRAGQPTVTRSFQRRIAATHWARSLERDMDRGTFVDRSEAESTTLGELIDRYLAEVTPLKKSAETEKRRLRLLKDALGGFCAAALQGKHLATWRDGRLASGLAGATVVKDLNTLSHVLDVAIRDWGLPLAANPVKLVRRPPVARGRDRRLAPGEEERLLAACRESRAALLAPLVVLAIETAMRLGELLSLTWPDVDLQARIARLEDTKNGEARRVPLSTRATEILRALPRHIGNPRVFWCWAGNDSVEAAWRRAALRAELHGLRFHDLRHEATSRLFERGFNVMEVAAITGHRTLQMLKRYTHIRAEGLVERLG